MDVYFFLVLDANISQLQTPRVFLVLRFFLLSTASPAFQVPRHFCLISMTLSIAPSRQRGTLPIPTALPRFCRGCDAVPPSDRTTISFRRTLLSPSFRRESSHRPNTRVRSCRRENAVCLAAGRWTTSPDLSLTEALFLRFLCRVDMLQHRLRNVVDVSLHSDNASQKLRQAHSLLLSRASQALVAVVSLMHQQVVFHPCLFQRLRLFVFETSQTLFVHLQ